MIKQGMHSLQKKNPIKISIKNRNIYRSSQSLQIIEFDAPVYSYCGDFLSL